MCIHWINMLIVFYFQISRMIECMNKFEIIDNFKGGFYYNPGTSIFNWDYLLFEFGIGKPRDEGYIQNPCEVLLQLILIVGFLDI